MPMPMSHGCRFWIALGLGAALVACTPPPALVKKVVSAASHKPGDAADPAASTAPATTPAPPAPPLVPAATGRLAGTLKIDARYAVQVGAAVLVGQVASIVANNGGTVVANNGGSLVANNGGGIISEHGGGIVSEHGGGLVANTRALFADAAPDLPPAGTLLPVAGMAVQATSTLTGKAYGAPVLTDASGVFHLAVPDGDEGNVLVVATPPDVAVKSALADRRLRYEGLSYLAAGQTVAADHDAIDEDTALVAHYIREYLEQRAHDVLVASDVSLILHEIGVSLPPAAAVVLTTKFQAFRDRAHALGYQNLTPDQQRTVAARLADFSLHDVKLDDIEISKAGTGWTGPDDEKALPVMVALLRKVREASAAKLALDPGFFDRQAYIKAADAKPDAVPVKIVRASDVGEFIIGELFAGTDPGAVEDLDPVLDSLAIGTHGQYASESGTMENANGERVHYAAAASGVLVQLVTNMAAKSDDMTALLDQAIQDVKAAPSP